MQQVSVKSCVNDALTPCVFPGGIMIILPDMQQKHCCFPTGRMEAIS